MPSKGKTNQLLKGINKRAEFSIFQKTKERDSNLVISVSETSHPYHLLPKHFWLLDPSTLYQNALQRLVPTWLSQPLHPPFAILFFIFSEIQELLFAQVPFPII